MSIKVWLVPHPLHQWVEDVKAVARKAGLAIIDPAVAGPEELALAVSDKDAPRLTPVAEAKPVKAAKGKSETPEA